ncbi:unnamed protein product, partial [Urochloa humidicola]
VQARSTKGVSGYEQPGGASLAWG